LVLEKFRHVNEWLTMKEKEMVGGCCVCSDDRGWDENPLVYCDGQGCSVAVHQGKIITILYLLGRKLY